MLLISEVCKRMWLVGSKCVVHNSPVCRIWLYLTVVFQRLSVEDHTLETDDELSVLNKGRSRQLRDSERRHSIWFELRSHANLLHNSHSPSLNSSLDMLKAWKHDFGPCRYTPPTVGKCVLCDVGTLTLKFDHARYLTYLLHDIGFINTVD